MAKKKRQKKQSFMPQLPPEIITDILLRLPVELLLRSRFVCKAWESLITSHHFVQMHLNHAIDDDKRNNRHTVILSSYNSVKLLRSGASNGKVVNVKFPLKNPKGFKVVGCCNGLLCVVLYDDAIFLWNPSTGDYKKLPVPSSVESPGQEKFGLGYQDLLGLGYDSSIDDYKVVKLRCKARAEIPMGTTTADIYMLKSDSWKKTQVLSYNVYFDFKPEHENFLNGALYCRSEKNGVLYWKVIDFNFNDAVLRFDIRDEKLTMVYPPHDVGVAHGRIFRLGVFGGSLCVVQNHQERGVEIWALKEDGDVKFSWSKLVSIPRMEKMRPNWFLAPICFTKNGGEVLMSVRRKEKYDSFSRQKKFYLYKQDEKATFKEFLIHYTSYCLWKEEITFIESLVSPNGVGTQR